MARRGKRKLAEAQPGAVAETDGVVSPADPQQPSSKRVQTRRELFVRGLASNTTSDDLLAHFSDTFPIKRGFVVTDPTTNQCKGYGFVTFADADDAAQAATQFQNSTLAGRKIKLEVAEPRHREVDDTLPTEVAAASGKNRSVPGPEAIAAKQERQAALDAKRTEGKPPRLIVRNLPWSIKKEADLEKLFMAYGKVQHVVLPKKGPGLLRGFGFVLLRGSKNAEKAVKGLNGKEYDGRTIAVDFAVDKDTWQSQNPLAPAKGDDLEKTDLGPDAEDNEARVGGPETSEQNDEDVESPLDDDESDESANEDEDDKQDADQEVGPREETSPNTLFVRNLPYTATDEILKDHFSAFGPIKYARVVLDPNTERPRGTGFVCFRNPEDVKYCLTHAPRGTGPTQTGSNALPLGTSILQDDNADPLGKYTLEGRTMQLARAVGKSEATRLANAGAAAHEQRMKDKRRLYLLNEGTISTKSALYESLTPAEKAMREASFKQRRALIQSNPSLHLSLTRLSVRNLPRTVDSKALKELARKAVVGFATDVKAGKREKLSKEELNRGGDTMFEAEKQRKVKKSGIVKQAKVVFETVQGSKAEEKEGGGRSRGYGFIEYHTHRAALMGLRRLNGHAVGYTAKDNSKQKKASREELQDRKKRIIVEFAIDNAQVVHRRSDRERRMKEQGEEDAGNPNTVKVNGNARVKQAPKPENPKAEVSETVDKEQDKVKRRNQIIARKRAKRRARTGLG